MKKRTEANEDFVDYRWASLNNSEIEPRMVVFWQMIERNGILKESAIAFLEDVWDVCVVENELHIDESYRQQVEEEHAIWKSIHEFKNRHHRLPEWLILQGAPEDLPPRLTAAFSSRKRNFPLERARHLVECARSRFGTPLYEAVAIVVSVTLQLDEDLTVDDIQQSCNSGKRKRQKIRGAESS